MENVRVIHCRSTYASTLTNQVKFLIKEIVEEGGYSIQVDYAAVQLNTGVIEYSALITAIKG